MPLLRDGRAVDGAPRARLCGGEPLPAAPNGVSVPLGRLATLDGRESARIDAIALAPDDDAGALPDALLQRLTLIEIDFPAYTDGRGYSHARRLRRRGYTGELRATGDVRPDQLLFMLRVGIDGAVLPDAVDPGLLKRTLERFEHVYQPSYPLPVAPVVPCGA